MAPTSIRSKVAGIAHHFKLRGFDDPSKDYRVQQAIRGTKRFKVQSPDSRAPLNLRDMEKIHAILPYITSSKQEAALFRTAFLLAFHGCLRAGEVATTSSKADPVIRSNDIKILIDGSISLTIHHSKASQFSPQRILIKADKDTRLCRKALKKFMKMRSSFKTSSRSAFLCHANGEPLTKFQLSSLLMKATKEIGMESKISSHSLRIGGASHAASSGMKVEELKRLGRWKSSAYKLYLRKK